MIIDQGANYPAVLRAEHAGEEQPRQVEPLCSSFRLPQSLSMRTCKSLFFFAMVLLSIAVVTGCATVLRTPLPEDRIADAWIPGMTHIRYWGDSLPDDFDKLIAQQISQSKAYDLQAFHRPSHSLAISGGGANGAFGAGLLVGWSEAGDRPTFSIVTGISTGALIAPFAFLGSKYYEQLMQAFTTTATKDILKIRSLLKLLSGDAVTDSIPLLEILRKYVTQEMLSDIAVEYTKGRRLVIGTTNLDAKRSVLWDITAIAASGQENALQLVHEIILASASVPGVFPPVYIKVEANGDQYDEMHVDGGTASQVFLYPPQLDHRRLSEIVKKDIEVHIYIIRNARLEPKWKAVRPSLGPIAKGALSTLILNQGMGNLELMYFLAMRDGYDYNLAYIPSYFNEETTETFDPTYMKKLFDVGYNLAKAGYPWQKIPPRLKKPEGKN